MRKTYFAIGNRFKHIAMDGLSKKQDRFSKCLVKIDKVSYFIYTLENFSLVQTNGYQIKPI